MTEQAIISGCLHNDVAAQRELYNRYSPKMLSVCYRFAQNREAFLTGGLARAKKPPGNTAAEYPKPCPATD